MSAHGGRADRAGTLRAATFNIHHGASADDHLDLARTAGEIRALDADVVGLQEVDVAFGDRSAGEDQARALAEMVGMDVAFAPAIDRPGTDPDGPRRQYGVALLVRGQILESETHLLPAGRGFGALREPRAVLCASVRTGRGASNGSGTIAAVGAQAPGGSTEPDLTVLVTHLDKERREHRVAQIGRIIELAARRARDAMGRRPSGPGEGSDDGARSTVGAGSADGAGATGGGGEGAPDAGAAVDVPTLLLGDMNADQGAPEMQLLAGAGWRDAALEASGRAPRARADGVGAERPTAGLGAALRAPVLAVAVTAVASALANVVSAVASRIPGAGTRPGSRSGRGRGGAVRGSFPAVFPVRRIDGIWVHGPLSVRAVEVAPGKSSDHRPVVATLAHIDQA
ncbi:endonuclease/exonuclease/phosphatase family protein [Brachybacterium subflavum]|uniref:endonuclease/exonuclease/phosphatase family protein n=1 Tax=Brachybacterium subflavum TaxID=2585206 RepID=UPI0012661049|nr:endonuclease/exonuclease/phosphatase family protein [Brachybacterium subflavum]